MSGGKFICVEEAAEEFTDFVLLGGGFIEEISEKYLRRAQKIYRKYTIKTTELDIIKSHQIGININELSIIGLATFHIMINSIGLLTKLQKLFGILNDLSVISLNIKENLNIDKLNIISTVLSTEIPIYGLNLVRQKFINIELINLSIVPEFSTSINLCGLDIYITIENKFSNYLKLLRMMDDINNIDED